MFPGKFYFPFGCISVPRFSRAARQFKRSNKKRGYHKAPPPAYWLEFSRFYVPLADNQYMELVLWKVISYLQEPVSYHMASTGFFAHRATPVDMDWE